MTGTVRFRPIRLPGDDGGYIYVLEARHGDGRTSLGIFATVGCGDSDDVVRSIFASVGLLDGDDLDTDPSA